MRVTYLPDFNIHSTICSQEKVLSREFAMNHRLKNFFFFLVSVFAKSRTWMVDVRGLNCLNSFQGLQKYLIWSSMNLIP